MARQQEPLEVIVKIVRGDGIILYASMSEEEKRAFGKRLNRRAIAAVENRRGNSVEFWEKH